MTSWRSPARGARATGHTCTVTHSVTCTGTPYSQCALYRLAFYIVDAFAVLTSGYMIKNGVVAVTQQQAKCSNCYD
jgi:hypothetical protein